MPVGLYIPPELLNAGLSPAEILIAAEILQFGDGKCYASSNHFSTRLSMPRRTVFRALKLMKESGFLTYDKGLKVINLAVSESATSQTSSAKVAAISAKVATAKMALQSADMAEQSATLATRVPDWHQNIEDNTEVKKKLTKKTRASAHAPVAESWLRLGRLFAEARQKQTGSGFTDQTVQAFGRLLADISANEPATEAEIESVIAWLATPAGREPWGFNIGKTATDYKHPFKRNFNMYRARSRNGASGGYQRTPVQQDLNMPRSVRNQGTPMTPEQIELNRLMDEGSDD